MDQGPQRIFIERKNASADEEDEEKNFRQRRDKGPSLAADFSASQAL
jgi:hypothetical protein